MSTVYDRKHTDWPHGICPRCGARVQVFFVHPVCFTHRGQHGTVCTGSGMYAKATK